MVTVAQENKDPIEFSAPTDEEIEALFQKNYEEMVEVTNELGLWDWFKTAEPPKDQGFMWWSHPNLTKFKNLMKEKGYLVQHSGASYAICLRKIQHEAKNITNRN